MTGFAIKLGLEARLAVSVTRTCESTSGPPSGKGPRVASLDRNLPQDTSLVAVAMPHYPLRSTAVRQSVGLRAHTLSLYKLGLL